jgi:hypothetical protein
VVGRWGKRGRASIRLGGRGMADKYPGCLNSLLLAGACDNMVVPCVEHTAAASFPASTQAPESKQTAGSLLSWHAHPPSWVWVTPSQRSRPPTCACAGHQGQAHCQGGEAAVAGLGHTASIHHADEGEGHERLPAKDLGVGQLLRHAGAVKAARAAVAHAHCCPRNQTSGEQRAKDGTSNLHGQYSCEGAIQACAERRVTLDGLGTPRAGAPHSRAAVSEAAPPGPAGSIGMPHPQHLDLM